jgi:hypothetical protein
MSIDEEGFYTKFVNKCDFMLPPLSMPYIHIQSDSGGTCNTLGNYSMCDSKQKSSYEHVSDFEFDFALRFVAASLKICYEMCQTSTRQGFVHC